MKTWLNRLAGLPEGSTGASNTLGVLRNFGPLLAPLLILLCAQRTEMLLAALAWGILVLPGALALNAFLPVGHPLGGLAARPGVASVLALVPFGLLGWLGCVLHLTLSAVLVAYGLLYLGLVAGLAWWLLRRGPSGGPDWESARPVDLDPNGPRWAGGVVIAGLLVFMAGVALATPRDPALTTYRRFATDFDAGRMSDSLHKVFAEGRLPLSAQTTLTVVRPGAQWRLLDGKQVYSVHRERSLINVYRGTHHPWWHGTSVACGGALIAALGWFALAGQRKSGEADTPTPAAGLVAESTRLAASGRKTPAKSKQASDPSRGDTRQGGAAVQALVESAAPALAWAAAAGLTCYLMLVAYSRPAAELEAAGWLPWNVDDVAYVSEAVDYQYGYPLGRYEPSIGSGRVMSRSAMSPLFAPLVAALARFTGIEVPALHHSVLPPLMVLLGASVLAGVLSLIFDGHRWAVPLGISVALLFVCKSWHYERCIAEMVGYRAMQTKALHLWLVHPLQLAAVVLLLRQASWRHGVLGLLVALVGHLTHPLATVLGAVWTGTGIGLAGVYNRRALPWLLGLLGLYGLLGVSFKIEHQRMAAGPRLSSGRAAGSLIESRDLVRVDALLCDIDLGLEKYLGGNALTQELWEAFANVDVTLGRNARLSTDEPGRAWRIAYQNDVYLIRHEGDELNVYQVAGQPVPRHDPEWAFGYDPVFNASVTLLPLALVVGWRRRAVLGVAVIGLVAVLICNSATLGGMLETALPPSIMWRARWMVPSLVILAVAAAALQGAWGAMLRGRGGASSPLRSLAAGGLTLALFASMLSLGTSRLLKPGLPPRELSKFSADMHALVELLGGVEARPFVWGPFLVNHELCQLMPHVRLVMSRDKFMLPADDPSFRAVVLNTFQRFQRGDLTAADLQRFLRLYPVDHIVIERAGGRGGRDVGAGPARLVQESGWTRVGQAGGYEVWRAPGAATN